MLLYLALGHMKALALVQPQALALYYAVPDAIAHTQLTHLLRFRQAILPWWDFGTDSLRIFDRENYHTLCDEYLYAQYYHNAEEFSPLLAFYGLECHPQGSENNPQPVGDRIFLRTLEKLIFKTWKEPLHLPYFELHTDSTVIRVTSRSTLLYKHVGRAFASADEDKLVIDPERPYCVCMGKEAQQTLELTDQ